jgi:MFS family permease
MQALKRRLTDSAAAFGAVLRNPNLRRLQYAAGAAAIGNWAYAVSVSVFAYHEDGASGVGLLWLIRSLPAAAATPFCALAADRFSRRLVMASSELGSAALMVGASTLVWTGQPALIVYILAAVKTVVGMAFGPADAALTPSLAKTPSELTAANAVRATIDSSGFFIGPAFAGLLLRSVSVQTVFLITTGLVLCSAFFIWRVEEPRAEPGRETEGAARSSGARAALAEVTLGFRTVLADSRLSILLGLLSLGTIVTGALEVLVVVTAFEVLHLGSSGVGYLNSALGIGSLAAAIVTAAVLVGVRRLTLPFVAGSLLWVVPLVGVAAFSNTAFALVMFALVGLGGTVADVAAQTLMQRAVPNEILGRVFGVAQTTWLVAIGVGAIATAPLVHALGTRGALVAAGSFLPVLLVLFAPRLIRIDAESTAPGAERLSLLRSIDIFSPLPGIALEQLASRLIPLSLEAGATIIQQGEQGDRFYIVLEGTVAVTADGRHVADTRSGGYFGEIALLRDVPRTATCTATTDVQLYALEREDFLAAVTGHSASSELVEGVIGARLAGLQTATSGIGLRSGRL